VHQFGALRADKILAGVSSAFFPCGPETGAPQRRHARKFRLGAGAAPRRGMKALRNRPEGESNCGRPPPCINFCPLPNISLTIIKVLFFLFPPFSAGLRFLRSVALLSWQKDD
jgi:hypothetical protein